MEICFSAVELHRPAQAIDQTSYIYVYVLGNTDLCTYIKYICITRIQYVNILRHPNNKSKAVAKTPKPNCFTTYIIFKRIEPKFFLLVPHLTHYA